MKQNVSSREYKVMLDQKRFVGSQADLLERAGAFWNDFKDLIEDIVFDTDDGLEKVDKQRTVRFYDTADRRLREGSYVFRERVDLDSGEREVTLKFRHPDRYISQDRDMAADVDDGKTKFEEDIKHPFKKLYSFSTKQQIPKNKPLSTLNEPGELYPDLKIHLKSFQENEPLELVEDFTAREVVIKGADFEIREEKDVNDEEIPKVEAECALIAWYDVEGEEDEPVVVEFSFKYGHEQEEYDGETAQRVHEVFSRLESMPAGWVLPGGTTKTAYAYNE